MCVNKIYNGDNIFYKSKFIHCVTVKDVIKNNILRNSPQREKFCDGWKEFLNEDFLPPPCICEKKIMVFIEKNVSPLKDFEPSYDEVMYERSVTELDLFCPILSFMKTFYCFLQKMLAIHFNDKSGNVLTSEGYIAKPKQLDLIWKMNVNLFTYIKWLNLHFQNEMNKEQILQCTLSEHYCQNCKKVDFCFTKYNLRHRRECRSCLIFCIDCLCKENSVFVGTFLDKKRFIK